MRGSIPSYLVGLCRIEVGSGAEKETGERDEDEGDEDGPTSGKMKVESGKFLETGEEVDNRESDEEDEGAVVEEIEKREVSGVGSDAEGGGGEDKNQKAEAPGGTFPPFVNQDAQAVEASPGDEVEGGAVP